jgi:hypothetical protein
MQQHGARSGADVADTHHTVSDTTSTLIILAPAPPADLSMESRQAGARSVDLLVRVCLNALCHSSLPSNKTDEYNECAGDTLQGNENHLAAMSQKYSTGRFRHPSG